MWFMVCHWPQSQECDRQDAICVDLHGMGLGLTGNGVAENPKWITGTNRDANVHHFQERIVACAMSAAIAVFSLFNFSFHNSSVLYATYLDGHT